MPSFLASACCCCCCHYGWQQTEAELHSYLAPPSKSICVSRGETNDSKDRCTVTVSMPLLQAMGDYCATKMFNQQAGARQMDNECSLPGTLPCSAELQWVVDHDSALCAPSWLAGMQKCTHQWLMSSAALHWPGNSSCAADIDAPATAAAATAAAATAATATAAAAAARVTCQASSTTWTPSMAQLRT
jgi:hypothetical protein